MRLRCALTVSAAVVAVAMTTSTAQAQTPSRDRVRQLLSGYEDMPTAEQWRSLGPGTLEDLVSLYGDASVPPYVRMRTITAAAHFPSPAARTFLLAVARAPGQTDLYVREAVLALGRAFGERAIDDIRPFARSRHAVVREGAAKALGHIGTPAAVEVLRRRLTVEGAEHVRTAIRRAITGAEARR